jgi:hypothetical protein
LAVGFSARAADDSAAHPCHADAAYRTLDFWLGRWEAFDSQPPGSKLGSNIIEKSAGGCALTETWHDADGGGEALGFFYYQPAGKQWKYILVSASGGIKERVLTEVLANGGVRFEGEVRHLKSPGSHLDRFTIYPRANGRVREVVEISRDAGKKWETTFDCEYRRR